jgi:hypothetical protein
VSFEALATTQLPILNLNPLLLLLALSYFWMEQSIIIS